MQEFTLGASEACDFVYDFDSVSANHLILKVDKLDKIEIIDNSSASGTYLKGKRIKSAFITVKDTIDVGEVSVLGSEIFSKIKIKVNKNRTNFIKEFEALKLQFGNYTKEEQALKRKPKFQQLLVRLSVSVILVLCLLAFTKLFGSNDGTGTSSIIILVLGSPILTALSFFFIKEPDLKAPLGQLKLKYDNILCCPKCDKSLTAYNYDYWITKRKCDRCGAIWA